MLQTLRAPPAAETMSKLVASATEPEATSNDRSPGALHCVSASPILIVYLPAGKCEMVTVKFFPLTSSRNARALSPAPSTVTDASFLRCPNSPVMPTCWPQEEQISSAANAAEAESHGLVRQTAEIILKAKFARWIFILLSYFTGSSC